MSLSGRSVLSALIVATVFLTTLGAAHGDDLSGVPGGEQGGLPGLHARELPRVAPSLDRIVGPDGKSYPSAPVVVKGKQGELFLGLEFDYACAFGGDLFDKGMRRLARLTDTIKESGRRVVFTVAPVKSLVTTQQVRAKRLPQGDCTAAGMRHHKNVIDKYPHPNYLPLRRQLRADPRRVYWRTDPHWTTVGGSVFAKSLAEHLRPALGARQQYAATQATFLGLLTSLLGGDSPETAEAAVPAGSVSVQTDPGSLDWIGFPYLVFDHSWTSSPASETWRGQTLLIGDSFSQFALTNLRPLFSRGRFMWTGSVEEDDMIAAMVDAKTVVIEVYELAVPISVLGQNKFIRKVRRALGVNGTG